MIEFKILEDPYRVQLDFNSTDLKYPLDVFFINQTGNISWQTKVEDPFVWVQGPNNKYLNTRVIDSHGDLVFSHNWEYNELSDIVEKRFINWCREFIIKSSKKPKGFVIGSHDGTSGEWVEAYSQNLISECLIIEPNINPFLSLTCNYKNDNKLTFKKCVISESDDFVDFYTNKSGDSESSSLLESNYLKHENNGIEKIKVKSYNPNTLIGSNIPDFIHIDAEGYDGNILLLINTEILNKVKFIIWEHIHLNDEIKNLVKLKLSEHGFTIEVGEGYNTCAYKTI
jgi:FkbM family methyltransferase